MVLESLMAKKSRLILELESAKAAGQTDNVRELAAQAAEMEEEIAAKLKKEGEPEKAVVNLLSAASLREDEGDLRRAEQLFRQAGTVTKRKELVRIADANATRLSVVRDAEGVRNVIAEIRSVKRISVARAELIDQMLARFKKLCEKENLILEVKSPPKPTRVKRRQPVG